MLGDIYAEGKCGAKRSSAVNMKPAKRCPDTRASPSQSARKRAKEREDSKRPARSRSRSRSRSIGDSEYYSDSPSPRRRSSTPVRPCVVVGTERCSAPQPENKRTYAEAVTAGTSSEDALYRSAKAEYEAAVQVYEMAKSGGFQSDALDMLWREAEARKVAMEKARPASAAVNSSKQRLSSLVEGYQKACSQENKWEQSVNEAAEHLSKLKQGLQDAQDLRKARLKECVEATIKHANIFVDFFATHAAECAQKPEMSKQTAKLKAAINAVQAGDDAIVDFMPLRDACAEAETTFRQAIASAKVARRSTPQVAIPVRMEEDAVETKSGA